MNTSFLTRALSILLIFFTCSSPSIAQQPQDDVLLSAMRDELDRNLKGLSQPGYDAPFFIMYGIQEQKTWSINAVLGSISKSTETRQRFRTNTRVLVGDYSFNDESLEDNLFSSPTALEINLPIDDDYAGIRRSFWSATDKVYRDAARHFKRHQETLKETGRRLDEIPHRSFAQAPAVKLVSGLTPYSFNKTEWENKLREISAVFLNDPSIQNSGVMLEYTEGHRYLVNSEGTVAKLPFRMATLMIGAQTKNEEGEFAMVNAMELAEMPDEFPSVQELTKTVDKIMAELEKESSVAVLEEEYSGPVLLIGPAVAHVFSSAILGGNESIMANDNVAKLTGYQFDRGMMSMDGKIGKSIVNESITVKATPKVKTFEGVRLFGGFEMDSEGIVPADELVVIENGVLRSLLNNRTITDPSQKANGYASGPGVLEITVAKKNSEDELKRMLLARAKEEGLDYAMIVREVPGFGIGLMNVYQVAVADGSEELVRSAMFSDPGMKMMRRVLGASDQYQAQNLASGFGPSRNIVSVICPQALLIEEMEIMPFRMPTLKEKQYVSNPLVTSEQ